MRKYKTTAQLARCLWEKGTGGCVDRRTLYFFWEVKKPREIAKGELCRELRPSHVQDHIGIIIVSCNNWIYRSYCLSGSKKPFLDNTPDLCPQLGLCCCSKSTTVRNEKGETRSISIVMSVSAMVVTGNYKRASTSSHCKQREIQSWNAEIPRPCLSHSHIHNY